MRKNKKGFIADILYLCIFICVLGIAIFFCTQLLDKVNTSYATTNADNNSKQLISDNASRMTPVFDSIFLLVFILLIVGIIMSLSMLRVSPVGFFLVIIIIGFMMIPVAILGNMFNTVQTSPSISATSAGFSITNFFMGHFVLIILGMVFITLAVLYAKP